jgi:hypothetical protein
MAYNSTFETRIEAAIDLEMYPRKSVNQKFIDLAREF